MTKRQTRQYAMLVRVRDFGNTHGARFPEGSEAQNAFASVTSAVAQVEAFTNAKLTARRISRMSKRAAKQVLMKRIGAIARSARALAANDPGADEKFPMPASRGDIAVLQTGRLFLQEGVAVRERFIRCGLPPTFLDDLQQAVGTFEQAISGRSAGRTGAIVSQMGIRSSIKSGVAAVQSLDAFVANVLGQDEAALNAWKRDRHVDLDGRSPSAPTRSAASEPIPAATSPASEVIEEPMPKAS
jgi:hypothetical protein